MTKDAHWIAFLAAETRDKLDHFALPGADDRIFGGGPVPAFVRAPIDRGRRALVLGGGALLFAHGLAAAERGAGPRIRRFLSIYEHDSTLIANLEVARGIEAGLSAGVQSDREMYSEYRDLSRFPGAEEDRLLVEELGTTRSSSAFS